MRLDISHKMNYLIILYTFEIIYDVRCKNIFRFFWNIIIK